MRELFLASLIAALPWVAIAESYPEAGRIVSVGGGVTEIIYALGAGDRVVARDTTSLYPERVTELPDVGYMRQLSAEGVLSVGPDLIITRDTAGPPDAIDQLRAASIPMVEVADGFTSDAVAAGIRTVGVALGASAEANALADQVAADFAALAADIAATSRRPRVLFVLSNQAGRLNVAGSGTGADGIISLAGGENVMAGAYEGYKILSDEALISSAPDVILMLAPTGSEELDANLDDVLSLPAIQRTPAGETGAVVTVDAAALGFGPRTAKFARALHEQLMGAGH
ncbi:heme/hemin ABC transporter substrate-binding protein [Celeribacter litoreus]|uniref:heme/hemin ABC transporter substrate-binding protein n=1 Tax=Celeribacter litoreus TaxID=2876714 RepID=UPI001CCD5E76|nr:ABC transporter substrate-binding protein [Celeribacter litoreus]MCA0043965.1 ABC transporter substrate-binding protein [Celeribacter litoreus]